MKSDITIRTVNHGDGSTTVVVTRETVNKSGVVAENVTIRFSDTYPDVSTRPEVSTNVAVCEM